MTNIRKYVASIAAAVVMVSVAHGQMTRLEETALPYDVYFFRMPAGDPVRFVPLQPLDLSTHEFALANGGFVCGFATGKPGTIYVDAYQNGPPGEVPKWQRLKLTVTGDADPDDPDDPDPPPLGKWATLSRDTTATIAERSKPLIPKIAANFRATAAAVAAGVIPDNDAVVEDLHKRNQAVWGATGEADWRDWLYTIGREVTRVDDRGELTVKAHGEILTELAKGLEAAQ